MLATETQGVHSVRLFSAAGTAPYFASKIVLESNQTAHRHQDYVEVMAMLEGSGVHVRIAGWEVVDEEPLEAGQLFLFRPRDSHILRGAAGAGLTAINVAFPLPTWQTFLASVGLDSGWAASARPPLVRFSPGAPDVIEPLERALARFRAGPTLLDLHRFLAEITPVLLPAIGDSSGRAAPPEWLVTSVAAMRDEANLREGVPRFQELAHVSKAHLARSVREHFGVTPTDLVAQLRLELAKHLLRHTMEPIGVIAQRCGYGSLSHFSSSFRSAMEASPRQYRVESQRVGTERPPDDAGFRSDTTR